MPIRPTRPLYTAAILERADGHFLIARPTVVREAERVWVFPRGRAAAGESAEAAMRRFAEEELGVEVEVVVGQPPFLAMIEGQEAELRYFFCGILRGEPKSAAYEELRWVSKAHLREYDFDAASEPVVTWLLEQ